MRVIPGSVIVKWPQPNYTNPETRGWTLVILNSVLIGVVTFTVVLRLYVRTYLLKWFGLDDTFIIVALVCTMGLATCVIVASVSYGWDRHLWDLPMDKWEAALKIAWATKIIFSAAAGFTRLALLFFYYRLVEDSGMRWFRNMIHFSVFVSTTTMLALIFLTIFQCQPIRAFWSVTEGATCLNEGRLTLGCGIANTFADVLVILLPIPLIAKLDLPPRRRLGAFILVSLGFIVCAAGAVRAYFTWLSLINSYDQTWECYGVWLSAAVEIDLGVICACAPALRLLFVRFCGPRLANLSDQISSMSPFHSKNSKTIASSGSDPTSANRASELLESKRHSTTLREKGFIITRGPSDRRVSRQVTPEATNCDNYLWDEPWTGNNHPIGKEELPTIDDDRSDSGAAGVAITTSEARQVSISRVNSTTVSSISSPKRSSVRASIDVVPTKGVGVLPDSSTLASAEHDRDRENKIVEDEEDEDSCKGLDLIIQRPCAIDPNESSIGFPSITARPDVTTPQRSSASRRDSWVGFDFDIPIERRHDTSDAVNGSGRKRWSWLDDKSSHGSTEGHGYSQSLGRPSSDLGISEEIGRERVRSWKQWRRADEMGWDMNSGVP